MRRVSKTDLRSPATAYGGVAVLVALPFVIIGPWLVLAGTGRIVLPGEVHAPLWVVGALGTVFFLAGAMLAGQGLRGLRNRRRARRAAERHFDEPWFLDHAWDRTGIDDRPGARALNGLGASLFMAVFLAPFHWWAFMSGQGPFMVKAVTILFDLFLLLVAGTALYHLLGWLRYGRTRLVFRRFPFHPGETLEVGLRGKPLERLKATLRFIEERYERTGSGDDASTHCVSYEHFSVGREIEAGGGPPEVEIAFAIPDNDEWVTSLSGQPVRYWELLIQSARPGVDFRTTFPLPVYKR